MRKIPQYIRQELRGLDDDSGVDANAFTLIVGTLVIVVPVVLVVMSAALAVYFSV
jgi:hypothetical protein